MEFIIPLLVSLSRQIGLRGGFTAGPWGAPGAWLLGLSLKQQDATLEWAHSLPGGNCVSWEAE